MQETELCPQIFERILDRRTGKCNPVLALQLDDRTESKGIIVLDILTLIKYDVFECVGAENINVISHHPISREYQMEMIEELLRMSLILPVCPMQECQKLPLWKEGYYRVRHRFR